MVYSEKRALTFRAYKRFIDFLNKNEKGLYDYLNRLGLVVSDEKQYIRYISKMNPLKDGSKDSWEEAASSIRYSHLALVDSFCSELKMLSEAVAKDGTVLCGGCGNGDVTEWLRRNTDAELVGIDFARKMFDNYEKPRIECIQADCQYVPIKNETFNQVLLIGVGPLNERMLMEAKRVLKPEGEVLIDRLNLQFFSSGLNVRGYEHFMNFFVDNVDTEEIIEKTSGVMELFSSNPSVMERMELVKRTGFEPHYTYPKMLLFPRGLPEKYGFMLPYAVIGKKI